MSTSRPEPSLQDSPSLNDRELLARIRQQDTAAFEAFYDRHAATVYGLLQRIVQDRGVADDLLQETFWQVWEKAAQFTAAGSGASWLYRIARNKALDHLRRRQARPQAAEPPEIGWELFLVGDEDVEEAVQRSWDREAVVAALAGLPAEQRRCLELAYFEGLSHREIAQTLSIPLGTVKTRLRMALEKLERALRAQGYPVEEH